MICIPTTIKPVDEHVLLAIIEFADGTTSFHPLHVGSEKCCKRVAEQTPAAVYNGDKEIAKSYASIIPIGVWDTAQAKYFAAQKEKEGGGS